MSVPPKTVAVLGASTHRHKFGNKSVRAHQRAGWRVLPINPHETDIEGLEVVARVDDLPRGIDRLTVYLPPPRTRALLPSIAGIGAREVWFNPGSATEAVLQEAEALGIPTVDGCSIVDLGFSPSEFPDD